MSNFVATYIHVNQFRLVLVEDQDTGLTYEVYLHTMPVAGGGSDLQVIVDPVEGLLIWKCWLREIPTPRVDELRRRDRERRQVELPGEPVQGQLHLDEHVQEVVADVMEAYAKENKVLPTQPRVERASRYRREPVI